MRRRSPGTPMSWSSRDGDFRSKASKCEVLSAAGDHITKPLPGAGEANSYCGAEPAAAVDNTENARSVGVLITYGHFRFLDLGDLTKKKEIELACPNNLLGTVDLFLVTHHGADLSNPKALVWALHPRVAVIDNGPRKGASPAAWQIVHDSPGLEDLWQLHYAEESDREHNVAEEPHCECERELRREVHQSRGGNGRDVHGDQWPDWRTEDLRQEMRLEVVVPPSQRLFGVRQSWRFACAGGMLARQPARCRRYRYNPPDDRDRDGRRRLRQDDGGTSAGRATRLGICRCGRLSSPSNVEKIRHGIALHRRRPASLGWSVFERAITRWIAGETQCCAGMLRPETQPTGGNSKLGRRSGLYT